MRKIILICVSICTVIVTVVLTTVGLKGPFKIYTYKNVEDKSAQVTQKLNELALLKNGDFRTVETSLKQSVSDYKTSYQKYDQISGTKTEEEKNKALAAQDYDLEFLWIKLGNHANETKCDLTLEVAKNENATEDTNSTLCDLKFNVVGSYSGIINFIEKIGQDSELGFIPENLKMYSEYRTVKVLNENNEVETSNKLMLITEFYKSNIPVSNNTLLKIENQEMNTSTDTNSNTVKTTSDNTSNKTN